MNHKMYDLDLRIHRYPSADGRHWSTPEQADLADGKITLEESKRIARERIEEKNGNTNGKQDQSTEDLRGRRGR